MATVIQNGSNYILNSNANNSNSSSNIIIHAATATLYALTIDTLKTKIAVCKNVAIIIIVAMVTIKVMAILAVQPQTYERYMHQNTKVSYIIGGGGALTNMVKL